MKTVVSILITIFIASNLLAEIIVNEFEHHKVKIENKKIILKSTINSAVGDTKPKIWRDGIPMHSIDIAFDFESIKRDKTTPIAEELNVKYRWTGKRERTTGAPRGITIIGEVKDVDKERLRELFKKQKNDFEKRKKQTPEEALKKIQTNNPNFQIGEEKLGLTWGLVPDDFFTTYAMEIDQLIETKKDINNKLINIIKTCNEVAPRNRTVNILALRSDNRVIPFINKLITSEDPRERYITWKIYRQAINLGKLPKPKDIKYLIQVYEAEHHGCVRTEIGNFFGDIADPETRETLEKIVGTKQYWCEVVRALGNIGDKRSVPAIIKACNYENRHVAINALSKIPTKESIDFLIENIDMYDAPEALIKTKSPRALPALKDYLKKLKPTDTLYKHNNATARVGIIILTQKYPQNTLLKLVEENEENEDLKIEALDTLCNYDLKNYKLRIAQLAVKEVDKKMTASRCRYLLNKAFSKIKPGRRRMLHLSYGGWEGFKEGSTELIRCINSCFKTNFKEIEEIQAFLDKEKAKQKKE